MRRLALAILVVALWPTLALAQSGQVVEYVHTDALGSVRVVTKVVAGQRQEVSRHDYLPFGEEVQAPSPPTETRLFTGKERDQETGWDYFGARYLVTGAGRFTTADPMLASAKTSKPQTFNRYNYALSNPLRFLDPDGLEVPKECVNNPQCTIVVKMRLLLDTAALRDGHLKERLREFHEFQLNRLKKAWGVSNITIQVTAETEAAWRGYDAVSGDPRRDELNVFVSDFTPTHGGGKSKLAAKGYFIYIGMDAAVDEPNTMVHEAYHTLFHVGQTSTLKWVATGFGLGLEWMADRYTARAGGAMDMSTRQGLANKPFAFPAHNPEVHTPKK